MALSFIYTAFVAQVFINCLVALDTRISSVPVDFGFDVKNINKSNVFSHNKTVVCVFDAWSYWRRGDGRFRVSDIDPTLCSQLVYRNAELDNTTFQVRVNDPHLAETLRWYRQTVALSNNHPHLKVLLSIGGWNEGSFTFSKIAADYRKRTTFVESVLRILRKYEFHGLDLAWEYPAWSSRGGSSEDKENLPLLVKDLRTAFGKDYIMSLTAAGDMYFAEAAYNIKALSNHVDQFNVRPFDFSGAWNNMTYHHSALEDLDRQSVMSTVNFYLENGVSPEKLVVGIPLYGRTFLLKENTPSIQDGGNENILEISGLGQPTEGKFGGEWVPDNMLMGYHEICYEMSNRHKNRWHTYWDNICSVPFGRDGKRWITFDSPKSIDAKVSFVLENNLKGVMAWTIDTDDFKGTACKGTAADDGSTKTVTFPLLRTINHALAVGESKEGRSRSAINPNSGIEGRSRHSTQDSDKMDSSNSTFKLMSNFTILLTGLFSALIMMMIHIERE